MIVRDFIDKLNSVAPFELAESWDNPGLMTGSLDLNINKVAVCLDAVEEAVIKASENGCEVLLCHHPVIFRAIKKIDFETEQGRVLRAAVKNDIAVIAAHTNWDIVDGGVNTELAKLIDLKDVKALDAETGLGAAGVLSEAVSCEEFLNRVKAAWGLSWIDYYRANNNKIKRVALCGGSGAEFWPLAKNFGADIYLTADIKYHELIDAVKAGVNIALMEHGEMEQASLPELVNKLKAVCGDEIEFCLLDVKALVKRESF